MLHEGECGIELIPELFLFLKTWKPQIGLKLITLILIFIFIEYTVFHRISVRRVLLIILMIIIIIWARSETLGVGWNIIFHGLKHHYESTRVRFPCVISLLISGYTMQTLTKHVCLGILPTCLADLKRLHQTIFNERTCRCVMGDSLQTPTTFLGPQGSE